VNFNSYGTWLTGCGKHFLYSSAVVNNKFLLFEKLIIKKKGKLDISSRQVLLDWNDFGHCPDQRKAQLHGGNGCWSVKFIAGR